MKISEKQIMQLIEIARRRLNDFNRLAAQQQLDHAMSFERGDISYLLDVIHNQQSEELKVIE